MAEKVIITKAKLDALAQTIAFKAGVTTPLRIDQMIESVSKLVIGGGSYTTYKVSYNLIGCRLNNSRSSVISGQDYASFATALSGYTLTGASVIITHANSNITVAAYKNGAIVIPNVSGDITISIVAKATSGGSEIM